MLTRKPFDPLLFLERTLELRVYYFKRGNHIVLDGLAALPEEKQNQARQVVRMYPRILELQMDTQKLGLRPSIRKLMAQGKVRARFPCSQILAIGRAENCGNITI